MTCQTAPAFIQLPPFALAPLPHPFSSPPHSCRPSRQLHLILQRLAITASRLVVGLAGFFLLMIATGSAHGQDRRALTTPAPLPPPCIRLTPAQEGQIQEALNHCPAGRNVELQEGDYVSKPLIIPSGVFLHLAQGSVLHASTNPADYDKGTGLCGQIDGEGKACRPFLLFDHDRGGGIYGPGAIDGEGGTRMKGQAESWWQLARHAQREHGKQNAPRLIEIDHTRNISFAHLTLRNAANFHVALNQVKGASFEDIRIDTPADARNTDGIDPGSSENITIAHSFIRTGDDNIAIKAGHSGPARHISILNTHLYWGHGLSIGSETLSGVSDVLISHVTLEGTRWGLRIKSDRSRGGLVQKILYEDICLHGSPFPLWFDTRYHPEAEGDYIPLYRDITLRHVHGDGGMLLFHGLDAATPLEVRLDDVLFPAGSRWSVSHTLLHGTADGKQDAPYASRICNDKGPPFPQP